MDRSLEELLADVAAGRLAASGAADRLRRLGYSAVGDYARLDVSRAARKGVPEVVYAEGKSAEQLIGIVARFLDHSPLVLCSRVSAEHAAGERSRVVVVRRAGEPPVPERGAVGVLAAGTSDLGVAGEAVAMCRAMGVAVVSAFDVGVAGLHRLATPLDEMHAAGVAAIVVAAGMEGARPADLHRLRPGRSRRSRPARHAPKLQPGPRGRQHRQRHRRRRDRGAHRPARRLVKALSLILRDHREELWRRWVDALADAVDSDYRELVASQLGERLLRTLIDDLIALEHAEQYERPGLLRTVEERTTADARHRLALGFTVLDAVVSLHILRGAISDVLVDALVLDEMPAFADTLDQMKVLNALFDRLVCATMIAA